MNIMGRKPVTYFACQHDLCEVACKNQGQAGNKNYQPLLNGMADKRSGRREPENKNGGI